MDKNTNFNEKNKKGLVSEKRLCYTLFVCKPARENADKTGICKAGLDPLPVWRIARLPAWRYEINFVSVAQLDRATAF